MVSRGDRRPRVSLAPKGENPYLEQIRKRIISAPTGPGIYRWLNEKGDIIYVGKAKNLKKRLTSYVQPGKSGHGPWRQAFLLQITDFDVTVTNTELEALLLETNLIKQLRPKFNVLMKDDKHYLYIRVTVQEPYPCIDTTRRTFDDGAKYFGPYLNSEEVRTTLDLLNQAIRYRACRPSLGAYNRKSDAAIANLRPCLEFQIGRCNGLCAGAISQEEFRSRIDRVIEFLKGNRSEVRTILEGQMKTAATDRKFELAAKIRNHLLALDRMEGKEQTQLASDTTGEDTDVFGVAVLSGRAHVVVLQRRNGKLIGESHYELAGQAEDAEEVLEQFLPQYYSDGMDIPEVVVVTSDFSGREVLETWLSEQRKKKTEIRIPERGKKSHLLMLAEKNAAEKARQHEIKWEAEKRNTEEALEGLQRLLELTDVPHRIEGYDISHTGGTETVGSMVVMREGKAANDHYRSFTIRTLQKGDVDDYRSLQEVLRRRLRRFCEDVPGEEREWKERGITFGKAKKAEQKAIEEIHAAHREEMGDFGISYKDYLVARHGEPIVSFGRLIEHAGKVIELKSIWVDDAWRGKKLGQFVARKLLRTIKKGKVYVTIDPSLEQYYGEIGFRYVIKPPKVLLEKIEEGTKNHARPGTLQTVVMLWEAHQNKPDPSLSSKPDLIVIDGGKGQLSSVVKVLKEFSLTIPIIGLAKREEEVFVPGRSDPVLFPKDSQAKFLLMRLRDEAHRFANRHREIQAKKKSTHSVLDEIPGIGGETKKNLLERFGTVKGIKEAADQELSTVVSESQLQVLRKML